MHDALKKDFTPEGLLLGYNSMYFDDPKASPLLKQFVRDYKARYNEYPAYECDHAYFCVESYKAAVEKAYAQSRQWPSKEQLVKALEGIEVERGAGHGHGSHHHGWRCLEGDGAGRRRTGQQTGHRDCEQEARDSPAVVRRPLSRAPACCRRTASEAPKPAPCRRAAIEGVKCVK